MTGDITFSRGTKGGDVAELEAEVGAVARGGLYGTCWERVEELAFRCHEYFSSPERISNFTRMAASVPLAPLSIAWYCDLSLCCSTQKEIVMSNYINSI
jgi:hypothetical protein